MVGEEAGGLDLGREKRRVALLLLQLALRDQGCARHLPAARDDAHQHEERHRARERGIRVLAGGAEHIIDAFRDGLRACGEALPHDLDVLVA
jgi:hypothetical protein